ncbi:hypothetical protein [Arthrobacter ramosus]|uniref:hypothetical protein n=1 Tax=Arthrobacter ramosus TaxID=1672 RepID=UPI001F17C1A8|nr:hypothetical protein [Arthrobacter ramosus]
MRDTESIATPYSQQNALMLGALGFEAIVLPGSTRALEVVLRVAVFDGGGVFAGDDAGFSRDVLI